MSVTRDTMGPWPMEDCTGLETAMLMLLKSLDAGSNYCQFDTIHKMIHTFREYIHTGSLVSIVCQVEYFTGTGHCYIQNGSDCLIRAANCVWAMLSCKMQQFLWR